MVRPIRVARATLAIALDNDGNRYTPGEVISGHIQVTAENTFKTDGGKMYFICRGFYAHDKIEENSGEPEFVRESRQYLMQQVDAIPPGTIRQGHSLQYPFSFAIPAKALPTHHGYACSIRWTLHATLDVLGRASIRAQQELFVESIPPALPPAPGGFQSDTSSPECQLTLILQRALCAEGETLEGQVRISPLESFDIQEIHVLLLRIENTSRGDDHIVYIDRWDPAAGRFCGQRQSGGQGTTYVWLEDEADLSGPIRLKIAEPLRFSFTLDIPAQWRPTMSTKEEKVTWKVGAVIAREDAPDVRAFHEVIVHTGMAGIPAITKGNRTIPAGN